MKMLFSKPKPRFTPSSRKQLSQPQPVLYYLARSVWLLSSILVSSIMFFFVDRLRREDLRIPYVITLTSVCSSFSTAILLLTSLLCGCYAFPSTSLIFFDLPLAAFWVVTLALLGNDSSRTITTPCSTTIWGSHEGVTVCKFLKATFSFAAAATTSAFAAVVLDVIAWGRPLRMGKYIAMGRNDGKGMLIGQHHEMTTMKTGILQEDDEAAKKMMAPEEHEDRPNIEPKVNANGMVGSKGDYEPYSHQAASWGSRGQIHSQEFAHRLATETRYDRE